MDLSYKKNDNVNLFSTLVKKELLNVSDPQNYVPLYSKFFTLSDNNFNNINLNNPLSLVSVEKRESENKYTGIVVNEEGEIKERQIFFKLSPLLDPTKYMIGKYDLSNTNLLKLPLLGDDSSHPKVRDPNNSAYVDSFFTYLTSQLLHKHAFIHGVDFFGSFLATKNDYAVNISDDIEYLNESPFFHKNKGSLFTIDNTFQMDFLNYDTRNYKKKLNFSPIESDSEYLNLADIDDLEKLDAIFTEGESSKRDNPPSVVFESHNVKNVESVSSTASDCSSRSSNTDHEDSENDEDSDTGSECQTSCSECSTATEDGFTAKLTSFPVQVITLERCEKTMDSLIVNNELSEEEWTSIIVQILMILITFQKVFGLTHNDLHTNNIMYVTTDKQFLLYKVNNKHYKVPTFGKIFKIIDFGRAIYKFRGNIICSDSFHPKGDASTQYNCEPYFNDKKPRLEPNLSFDLCRLGCSLFDFIAEDLEKVDEIVSPISKIIMNWCKDDKGRNIMYKNNGEERYPEFKLYKMIARTVHNHIPQDVLKNQYFERYIISKKKIKTQKIMNIDQYPCYMELKSKN
jgi:hypothetical protein